MVSKGSLTFEAVYRENIRHVLRVIRCRRVHPADREDAAQEAFLTIERHRHTLDPAKGSIRAYVGRIAWQQAGEYLRLEGRRRGAPLGFVHEELDAAAIPDPGPTTEELMTQEEDRRFLHETLERMPADWRAAFELHHLEELSVSEVAFTLEVSERTVKYWIARTREELEAAVKRRRAAEQRRGAVVLPISAAALLERERAHRDDITDAECERVWARFLRASEEEAQRAAPAEPRARPSDPGGWRPPPSDPSGWLPPPPRVPLRTLLRVSALSGLLGGAAGGAIVWALLHGGVHATPVVTWTGMASAIPNAGQVAPPAGAGAVPVTLIPAGITAIQSLVPLSPAGLVAAPSSIVRLAPSSPSRRTTPRPPSPAAAEDPEETMIRMAREALAASDFTAARATLDTHAQRFPKGRLSTDREVLRAELPR